MRYDVAALPVSGYADMKFEDFIKQAPRWNVSVGLSCEGWTLITMEAEGQDPKQYTVHGSAVVQSESEKSSTITSR